MKYITIIVGGLLLLLVNCSRSPSEVPSAFHFQPWGGLVGDDLDRYIAANPGPVAIIGLNPSNPGERPRTPASGTSQKEMSTK